jgi:ribose-phosphate pyrophosphokinase
LSVEQFVHAILSGDAYEKIEKSQLLELIVTDSIPLKKESKKIRVLSCAPFFLRCYAHGTS